MAAYEGAWPPAGLDPRPAAAKHLAQGGAAARAPWQLPSPRAVPAQQREWGRGRGRGRGCAGGGWLRTARRFALLFLQTSSIHGLAHLVARGRSAWEYALWLVCFCVAVAGCLTISLRTLSRYNDNPTVISLERDYKMWNTSFPTATVCPSRPWDPAALAAAASAATGVTDKEAFIQFLQNLTVASYDSMQNIAVVPGNPITPDRYQSIVNASIIHRDLQRNITNSDGAVPDTIQESFTERGICYTYNSALAGYNSYAYWKNNSWSLLPPEKPFFGNALTGDRYTNWFLGFEAELYVHGAGEVADCARRGLRMLLPSTRTVRLLALTIYSADAVRALRLRQRRCRLPHESPLALAPVYTYGLCRRECRRRLALRRCGCAPFFYRAVDNSPICNETQMSCLAENEDTLIKLVDSKTKEKIKCDCLPLCDEVTYAIQQNSYGPWTSVAAIQWGMVTFPQTRLKRDVIFGFTDLLVAVGGTAGLFLGCSVLSFVEIGYFFTLRLFWHLMKYDQERNL